MAINLLPRWQSSIHFSTVNSPQCCLSGSVDDENNEQITWWRTLEVIVPFHVKDNGIFCVHFQRRKFQHQIRQILKRWNVLNSPCPPSECSNVLSTYLLELWSVKNGPINAWNINHFLTPTHIHTQADTHTHTHTHRYIYSRGRYTDST